jgi:hypothetical protein
MRPPRPFTKKTLPFFFLASIMVNSCNLFTDEETDQQCADNVITVPYSLPVQYQIKITKDLEYPTTDHRAYQAEEIQFRGYIRQMDCMQDEKTYKELYFSIYPKETFDPNDWGFYFNVGPSNSFTFSNRREYFSITYTMSALFSDETVYESSEVTEQSNYFNDMMTQGDDIIIFLQNAATWHKVEN